MKNKIMLRVLLPVFLGIVWSVLLWAQNPFQDIKAFSADVRTETGGNVISSKMLRDGARMRMEMTMGPQPMIMILRMDKKVSYMLVPSEQMYMEMPLDQRVIASNPWAQGSTAKMDIKKLGEETVDGHPCTVNDVTTTYEGATQKMKMWLAQDLKGFPVKVSMQTPKGSTTIRYINISLAPIPASKFEIPAGYQKMQMPSMPPR